VTRLECNVLFGRSMNLNSLTWLLVIYVFFQMYIAPTLIQSAYNSRNATSWQPHQIHLPIVNILHFTFNVGGKRYHVVWLKLFLIHPEVHQLLEKQLQRSTNLRTSSGKPNTLGSSKTLSNSIPCVSNCPFVMGNQFTKKETYQVIYLLIKYGNVYR
jgi:hypothetical protein